MSNATVTGQLESLRDHTLGAWDAMHGFATGIIDNVPEEHWFAQAGAGTNHTMWVVGHLAFSYGIFIERAGGENEVPAQYADLFNMGTEPQADPSLYPSVKDVRAEFERSASALRERLASLNAEELAVEVGEPFADVCPTRAHTAMLLTFHDGIHAGQVMSVRKSLGLAPTMA